jgi:DegV family protein with EDD domain
VFPIPDGDTGTNLAVTFRAMVDAVKGVGDVSVSSMASRLAESGVLSARGNSGMMMSHFFLGFAEGLRGRKRAGPEELALAMRSGSDSLYKAVERPVEGTILTVVRESTEEIERVAGQATGLESMARRALAVAQQSLKRTPTLLSALRDANVVDAGAKGFVRFLEGAVGLVEGRTPAAESAVDVPDAAALADFPAGSGGSFRYCAEYVIRGDPLPERRVLAGAVRELGDSLIVTRASTLAKVHIHTDEPERVEKTLRSVAGSVECVKAEDMQAQHRDEFFHDQDDMGYDEFLTRLKDPSQPHPTTSQPSPADLLRAFDRAGETAEAVLGIFVGSGLSGTLGQAQAAAARLNGARVNVLDSRSGSLGLGFQVLRAAELAEEGSGLEEIAGELRRIQERSGLLLTVDTLKYLQRSGRVGKARAFLASLFDLKPILGLDRDGVVIPVDKVRGRKALMDRVLRILDERVAREGKRLRMGVAHVDCPDVAAQLASALERDFQPDELIVRPAASVLAAHTGLGAWAVFYQVE